MFLKKAHQNWDHALRFLVNRSQAHYRIVSHCEFRVIQRFDHSWQGFACYRAEASKRENRDITHIGVLTVEQPNQGRKRHAVHDAITRDRSLVGWRLGERIAVRLGPAREQA